MRTSRAIIRSHPVLVMALIAVLILSAGPTQTASAQGTVSDLTISLVSVPKHVKACQTFEATYTVTNLGPDPASQLYLQVSIPDAYQDLDVVGLPESLGVGATATVTLVIKVLLFEPGEIRGAWVGVTLVSDYYPEPSIDPNPENNTVRTPMRIIGKHVSPCP